MIPFRSVLHSISRRHFFLPLSTILLLSLASCGGKSGYFKISGRLANIDQGEFYIYSPDGAIIGFDTIHVTGGRFTYERPCEREALMLLVFPNFSEQPIFAEPGEKVTIKGDVSHLRDIEIEGTKANNLMTRFRKQTQSMLPIKVREQAAITITDNPDSPIGLYLIRKYFLRPPGADYAQAASLIELMLAKQSDNRSLQILRDQVNVLKNGVAGEKIATVNVTDDNGNTLSYKDLSDGLVAISVWSSWSYESQEQQRKLRRYQRSSGGKLKVVSISVDANNEEINRIMKRDSIQWTNVNEVKMFEGKLLRDLGIYNVPDMIVVRDGRIIERNVNMGNMEETLDKLLK